MLARLAEHVATRPRAVLVAAVAFLAVAGIFGGPVAGLLSTGDDFQDPGAQSVAAGERLERAGGAEPAPAVITVVRPGGDVKAVSRRLGGVKGVARIAAPAPVAAGEGVSLAAFLAAGEPQDVVADRVEEALGGDERVLLGGPAFAEPAVGDQVSADLARAELLAFPILFLLSLWVFRGVVAALLPLAVGALTIMGTFLGLRVVNEMTLLSIFALNLSIGLGLGLAIDYSLFVISRYREELAGGLAPPEAIRRTMATAGRTVVFSALTVAAALLALLVFPQRFLYSMGVAGALTALMAMVVSLTALPAVLVVLGRRIDALAPRPWQRQSVAAAGSFWDRWARGVMRRPRLVAGVTAAVLIVVGLSATRIDFVGVDASVLPRDSEPREVADALGGGADATSPITIALTAPEQAGGAVAGYTQRLDTLPAAGVSDPRFLGKRTWQVDVVPPATALDQRSLDLVEAIRDVGAPGEALVAGQSARFVDQQAALADRLPLAAAILALTTLVLLFALTGSVVLPVKALLMNVLTLSAAFGLLVLVFQDGRFEDALGYVSQGGIESTQPLVLLAIAFGLSTDYAVFLLTRIKEEHDRGAGTEDAVAFGLARTGRIVTAAAVLFCVAIGAFATSEIIFIKQVGLGTAAAVLIDATIVRALLVPALMKLLGDWNWWAPLPLRRLHKRFGWREDGAGRTAPA